MKNDTSEEYERLLEFLRHQDISLIEYYNDRDRYDSIRKSATIAEKTKEDSITRKAQSRIKYNRLGSIDTVTETKASMPVPEVVKNIVKDSGSLSSTVSGMSDSSKDNTHRPQTSDLSNIVKTILRNMMCVRPGKNAKTEISMDDFVHAATRLSSKYNIELPADVTIEGALASELYDLLNNRIAIQEDKNRNKYLRNNLLRFRRKDFESLKLPKFDEKLKDCIVGMVEDDYILKNYSLKDDMICLSNGMPCSVEGSRTYGKEKDKARNKLFDFILENIIIPKQGKYQAVSDSIAKIENEIQEIESRTGNSPINLGYKITVSDKGAFLTFKRRETLMYKKIISLNNKPGIRVEENGTSITIYNNNPDNPCSANLEETISDLNEIKNKRTYMKKTFDIEKIKAKRNGNGSSDIHKMQELQAERERLIIHQNELRIANYLGLEGPAFTSLLPLQELFKEGDIILNSVVPEYNHRDYNIMLSFKSAFKEAFKNVNILECNINNLILLDFPVNHDMFIKYCSSDKKDWVYLKDKNTEQDVQILPLETYAAMLSDLDNSVDKKKIAQKYCIDIKYINIADKRHPWKFDAVFLDYFSGDSYARQRAISSLNKRLNDDAVIAITTDLAKRLNFGRDADKVLEQVFDATLNKYNIISWDFIEYSASKEKMSLMMFYVKKK